MASEESCDDPRARPRLQARKAKEELRVESGELSEARSFLQPGRASERRTLLPPKSKSGSKSGSGLESGKSVSRQARRERDRNSTTRRVGKMVAGGGACDTTGSRIPETKAPLRGARRVDAPSSHAALPLKTEACGKGCFWRALRGAILLDPWYPVVPFVPHSTTGYYRTVPPARSNPLDTDLSFIREPTAQREGR